MIYTLGLNVGLTVTDIDKLTAGMLIDLAYYKSNQMEERKSKNDNVRSATQADYDSF
jgi:hypothetical protein